MSSRLGLSGFRLEKLRSLFGSGRQDVVDEVGSELERAARAGRRPRAEVDEALEVARSALRDAIHGGVPLPGLAAESEPHAALADRLACYGQKHRQTDCDIKAIPLWDFWEEYGKAMGPTGRRLFGYLVKGRPLFAPRFRPGSAPVYGYLDRDEAATLSASLGRMLEREMAPRGEWDEDDVEELLSDFIEWLDDLGSRKLDVWAFIS